MIPIDAISKSTSILALVHRYIVNQDSPNSCTNELIWICSLYLVLSAAIAIVFFRMHQKKKAGLFALILFLLVEFYVLQTPFFIFEVGTYYNCRIDGQSVLGIIVSSPKASIALVLFGIIYDVIGYKHLQVSRT